MAIVHLYCPDTPGLHLGPGIPSSPRVINFLNGYADLDEDDPLFAEKMSWINGPGCPHIRILDVDEVPSNDPSAVPCPACGLTFATERKLNGHILGAHRNRA